MQQPELQGRSASCTAPEEELGIPTWRGVDRTGIDYPGAMDRRTTLIVVAVAVLAAVVFVKSYFAPERVIVRSIQKAAAAVEDEQLLGAIKPFFKGYRDLDCGFNFEFIASGVHEVIETFDLLRMNLEVDSVEVDGDAATMEVSFHLAGSPGSGYGDLLGSAADPCRVRLDWEKKSAGWLIVSSSELDVPNHRKELDRRCGR
jgi:hypothetical protein